MQVLPSEENVNNQQCAPKPAALKHYQFRQRLGEGGFGQVFEAWDSKLLRTVAVKRLKPGVSGPDSSILLREARLAASLSHPAFVKIHALEEGDDQTQSIVMELVQGQTLKQLLARQKPALEMTLDIVTQIARAMQEAHAAGLTHGDLKPSNLMLDATGKVRILDFGLARQTDGQATTSMLQLDPQGTIAYMSPERLLGAALSPLCDVYALGVILYELLSGQRPFAELGGLALAAAQVQTASEQWPWPGAISPALRELIIAMTNKQEDLRLPSMGAVLAGLAALNNNHAVGGNGQGKTGLPVAGPIRIAANRWQRRSLGWVLVTLLLATGLWQSLPWVQAWWQEVKPYSEALEMKNGLAALKLFDRPGSLDRAEASFNTILQHNPKNAAAVAGVAMGYIYRYRSDDHDPLWLQKAMASMQYALSLNDQLVLSHVAKAMVLGEQGKWEEALAVNQRALALDQSNTFAMWHQLRVLIELQRYADAIENAKEFIKRNPGDRMLIDYLGEAYQRQGNYQAAEAAFRDSIRVEPDAVASYSNLAYNLFWQHRNDEGLRVLQDGLQIRPNFNLYTNLGNALFVQADYVGAAAAFERAVSPVGGKPGDYLGWANLADTLLWLPGRRAEAKAHYEKAYALLGPRLEREKTNPVLLYRMGLYCARIGKREEAVQWLQQALKQAPDKAVVHFRAGMAYELLGERQIALSEISKAVKLGYPSKLIGAEPDLLALRRDPNYLKN
jgi:serine/threonine-protein kinase